MMERLTERYKDSIANTVLIRECGAKLCEDICNDIEHNCSKCELEKAFEKLADYEDLEEQGLLVRLPCPIGTTVWDICGMDIRENVLSGIECDKDGKQFLWANEDEWLGELNDLVFLSREEAEKKLEEMKK
ncbi:MULTISPECIES: hypothetical protein [unclassified Blautia]|uniref:hypothetical protein n=1 Tax=unclassified Blautia TaxID=2648079 RepID=UPI003F8A5E0C